MLPPPSRLNQIVRRLPRRTDLSQIANQSAGGIGHVCITNLCRSMRSANQLSVLENQAEKQFYLVDRVEVLIAETGQLVDKLQKVDSLIKLIFDFQLSSLSKLRQK